jgi:hypothetical protein
LRQIGARENTARSRRRGDALEALSNKQTRVYGTLESHLRRARRGAVRLRGFDARILGLPLLVPRRPRRGFHPSGSPTRAAPSTRSDQSCLGKRKIRREFEPGNRFTISRQMRKRGSFYSKRRVRDLQPICGRRGKCAPSFIQAPRFDAAPAADDGHFAKHGPDVRGFPPSRTGLFASHPSVTEPATTGTDGRLTPRAPRDGCGETQCRAPRDWA